MESVMSEKNIRVTEVTLEQVEVTDEMSDWQPIETAKMNGTKILVGYVGGFVGCARFLTWPHRGWYREGAGISSEPTHWMYLPEPPAEAQRKMVQRN